MNNKIVVLVDYRKSFWSRVGNQKTLCTLDVEKIENGFRENEFEVNIIEFSSVNFQDDWNGVPFVYTSSEDYGLLYKSYIEDIVIGLESAGALAIPSYRYLRAHHNKVMMEVLRYCIFPEDAKLLGTKFFGNYEELRNCELSETWPKVIKSSFGAGSTAVELASNNLELLRIARKFSLSFSVHDFVREFRSRFLWSNYVDRSLHRKKFIVQNLIKNLNGDFKVLKYGTKFYVLSRANRPGDFRASGSGNFSYILPDYVDNVRLLDYAEHVSEKIGTPFCSMDIAFDGTNFYLLEFQCLNFGSLTAENSEYYNIKINKKWEKIYEKCDLEKIFCEAIICLLKDKMK